MNNIKFIKRSTRNAPKISLILLDWSVRESFHLFHYLSQQTVPRDAFEVTVIEYYSRVSGSLQEFEGMVDNWIVMGMPEDCYYHKHLMYNVGIAASHGDIVMIGDSDAMVKETFIETILHAFEKDPNIVFHMDQFRNMRRDLHPFSYPSFDEVQGEGCINNTNGQTSGVLNTEDPLHTRNYGACMCARREDLIAIGGADEHIDYLGHICGPYDMTFRLVNLGRKEVWSMDEFMHHTWHPGQAGADNYLGPHDGRHMSTTALEALTSRRTLPYVENAAIGKLRNGMELTNDEATSLVINPIYLKEWNISALQDSDSHVHWNDFAISQGNYNGFHITIEVDRFVGSPIIGIPGLLKETSGKKFLLDSASMEGLKAKIDALHPKELLDSISMAFNKVFPELFWGLIHGMLREFLAVPYRAIKSPNRETIKNLMRGIIRLPRTILSTPRALQSIRMQTKSTFGCLATAIYYFTQSKSVHKPVVLVNHDTPYHFLQFLKESMPPSTFDVLFVSNADDIKISLEEYTISNGDGPQFILWHDLYARFHDLFINKLGQSQIVIV
jgi:hypothetical protein